ncbi:MAG: hypothetical protein JST00_11080 [Deltaproteobacteria bacterium]|nr:hypothetical protein [Deltaproteobacteria bacterium]
MAANGVRRAAVIVIALATGCSVAALDLAGKKCPCATGYECDVPRDTCVPVGTLVADSEPPDVRVVDSGTEASAPAPLVLVSDLRAAWATPSSMRWEWKVLGDKKSFRAYEVVVGKSEKDVATRAAGVDVLRGAEHPELDLFDARGGATNGPFTMWTTTDGNAPTPKFVQVHATDVNGVVSSTKVVSFANPPFPGRTKVVFDGVERMARPAAYTFKTPAGGEANYELVVDCGGANSCAQKGELYDLGIDLAAPSAFTAADFDAAFLTFDIEGNVASSTFGSTVGVELGASCAGGAGVCRFRYAGWTQRKSGRTTVQVPLAQLRNDDGPLTYAILQQKNFLVQVFELSGRWRDKDALRLYNARIRW